MLAGIITGILHTKMKIPALLAGILTMIALYSVNLRIMGKANLSLLGVDTTFKIAKSMMDLSMAQTTLVVGLAVTVLVGCFMYWFFGTQIGAAIRATGFNQQMIRAQGVDTDVTIILACSSVTLWLLFPVLWLHSPTAFPMSVWVPAQSLSVWHPLLSARCFSVHAALKTA